MAILIDMDMPGRCFGCGFCYRDPDCFVYVCPLVNDAIETDVMKCRPDWCPLREVVRCKECIYWVPDQVGVVEQPYCTRLGCGDKLIGLDLRIGSPDHFCCLGERREE